MTTTYAAINNALTLDEKRVVVLYAKNNMRINGTAKQANYHERTIHTKLHDVYKKTGLDPKMFHDLVLLVFAIAEGGKEYA